MAGDAGASIVLLQMQLRDLDARIEKAKQDAADPSTLDALRREREGLVDQIEDAEDELDDAGVKRIEQQTMVDVDATPLEIAIAKERDDVADARRRLEAARDDGGKFGSDIRLQWSDFITDHERLIEELERKNEQIRSEVATTDPEALNEHLDQARQQLKEAESEKAIARQQGGDRSDDIEDWYERQRVIADSRVKLLERKQDDAARAPGRDDTGHYDDGHGFGWSPVPDPALDTGHYDDGHAFGWGRKKKVAVATGIVAALLAMTAAVVAARSGGGSSKATPAVSTGKIPPVVLESSSSSSTASSSSSSTVSVLPVNTVLAGCIAIDPQGSITILHPGFLVANPQPGTYTAEFAKSPSGPVRGTGSAGGNLVVADVTIRAFGAYDGLTLTGPDGAPIALGPLSTQLPLDINAQTDKPNGCDPAALQMPASSTGGRVDADHAAIEAFLPQFSHASQARDIEFLVDALDPAVLARYGREQCTADLSRVPADPTANFVFRSFTAGPELFTYASDGQSAVVQNTYTVAVSRTADGTTSDADIHLSVDAAGAPHWFTDCTH